MGWLAAHYLFVFFAYYYVIRALGKGTSWLISETTCGLASYWVESVIDGNRWDGRDKYSVGTLRGMLMGGTFRSLSWVASAIVTKTIVCQFA